ncbi:unnamed protein product [Natator depressus]
MLLQILIGTFVLLANSVSESAAPPLIRCMSRSLIPAAPVPLSRSRLPAQVPFSYSGEYGSSVGTLFSYSGDHLWGPITAFQVWEYPSKFIKAPPVPICWHMEQNVSP